MKVESAVFYLSIMMLIMSLAGCGGSSQDIANQDITNIQVNLANPEISVGSTEDIPLPNCEGNTELTRSLRTETSVAQKIEIGDQIIIRAGGEAGAPVEIRGFPVDLKAKLEGEVEHSYRSTYASASSRVDEYTMRAAPESNIVYVVEWEEQLYSSTIMFDYVGKTYEAPYAYIIRIPNVTDSHQIDCPALSSAPAQPNINDTPVTSTNTICGELVSPETLASCLGGNAAYWTPRGPDVWGYWDKGHNVTFRHPGGGSILTYWAGFPDPRNSQGCRIVVVQSEDTKYVKCDNAGAEFESDGVGFHLVDHTSVFK